MPGTCIQFHDDVGDSILFELPHKLGDSASITSNGICITANNQNRDGFGYVMNEGWIVNCLKPRKQVVEKA